MFRFSSALDTLLALQDAVEAARTSDYFGLSTTNRGSYPSINLFQDGDDVILMAEVPGMKKEDIQVQIKDNLITISGERKVDYPEESSIHRLERRSLKFNRTMKLPSKVNIDQVKADYQNGILKVVLPRAESDRPKMIDIH
ncbi:Hsp20/alpha crystallin family protein [bacterium]|nr:Hsp20/alpha crystallin family protein [bacterium]